MTVPATLNRWRHRFAVCLVLGSGAMLLTGAREVTSELRHRPAVRRTATAEIVALGRHLTRDVYRGDPAAWQRLAEQHPVLLLQACSQPGTAAEHMP